MRERPLREYYVWDKWGRSLGRVWASRKAYAQLIAEHRYRKGPKDCYVGLVV